MFNGFKNIENKTGSYVIYTISFLIDDALIHGESFVFKYEKPAALKNILVHNLSLRNPNGGDFYNKFDGYYDETAKELVVVCNEIGGSIPVNTMAYLTIIGFNDNRE